MKDSFQHPNQPCHTNHLNALLQAASWFEDTFGLTTVLAAVARLGVFLRHIKACLRCVSVGFLPKIQHRIERR